MNTRAIAAAAGVIHAAMQTRSTAAGIAMAVDAAGMLMSPETATAHAAEVDRLRAERSHLADLACEYRVPIEGDPTKWLLVRREPTGDRWAILTSHRIAGKRRAWVGGRWQTMPVVGPVGLWEYTTSEAAICQATALATAAEGGEPRG